MKPSTRHLPNNKILYLYTVAVLLFVSTATLSLCFGSTSLSLGELVKAILNGEQTASAYRIFVYVRLPRTLASLLVGGALACAGATIQGTLHNRLASPSIIGVNAGAGLAITVATAFGLLGGFWMSFLSFLGALVATLMIALLSKHWGLSRSNVILCGVALNAFFGAVSQAIITLFPNVGVMSNDFRVGDVSSVTYRTLLPASILIVLTLFLLFTLSSELDVLSLGDERASGLGLSPSRMRMLFLILSSVLAGASVSLAGLLSFVGLILPHTMRLFGVYSSRHLLPLCTLYGASFVTVCDLLSRTLFAPYEIPVGILMAFIGAPFFIFLLFSKKGGGNNA